MVLKAQALAFLLSFFATQAVANTSSGLAARADINKGNAYLYECGNCKCDDSWQNEGFQGDTGCVANIFGSSARAIGLTADNHYLGQKGTTCALFTSGDCSGQVAQSIGVENHQKWGCTAFNQEIGSFKCYFK